MSHGIVSSCSLTLVSVEARHRQDEPLPGPGVTCTWHVRGVERGSIQTSREWGRATQLKDTAPFLAVEDKCTRPGDTPCCSSRPSPQPQRELCTCWRLWSGTPLQDPVVWLSHQGPGPKLAVSPRGLCVGDMHFLTAWLFVLQSSER